MTNFEFVVSTGAPTRATAAVRSHAVKSGLQRKQSPKAGLIGGSESLLTIRQKSTLTSRFRVTEKDVGSTKRKASKRKAPTEVSTNSENNVSTQVTLQGGQEEQFETWLESRVQTLRQPDHQPLMDHIPLLFSHGLNVVIKFFLSRLNLHVTVSQVSQFWWGFSTSDPLVLHTALGVAASTWALNIPDTKLAYAMAYKHKAMAMPTIRSKLRANDISDAVVGAVANLAQMEALESNYEGARMHLNALKPIVHSIGGWQALKDKKEVSTAISWPDIIVAIEQNTCPMFPLVHEWECVRLPGFAIQAAEQPSLSHLRIFERNPHDATLRYTFSLIRQTYFTLRSSGTDYIERRILFNCVDHRMATYVAGSEPSTAARMVVVAAQIYFHCVIRGSEAGCLLPSILSLRLVELLRAQLEGLVLMSENWYGILWALTIGMVFTLPGSVEWAFFVLKLRRATEMAGIVKMAQLEMTMQRFVWDSAEPQLAELLEKNEPFVFMGESLENVSTAQLKHDYFSGWHHVFRF